MSVLRPRQFQFGLKHHRAFRSGRLQKNCPGGLVLYLVELALCSCLRGPRNRNYNFTGPALVVSLCDTVASNSPVLSRHNKSGPLPVANILLSALKASVFTAQSILSVCLSCPVATSQSLALPSRLRIWIL